MSETEIMREMNHYFQQEKRNKLNNYRQLNAYVKKGGILFTGSSLMEQFPVCEYCMSAGIDKTVYNRGIGGYTTDEFIDAIDVMLLDLKPSKVFINIGTNDISERADGQDWKEHLLANYEYILTQIKEKLPETEVYMMAYYPVNEHLPQEKKNAATDRMLQVRTNQNLQLINEEIAKLADRFRFHFINVNQGLTDERGDLKADYTVEGVHMYSGAYHIVFENLRQYI